MDSAKQTAHASRQAQEQFNKTERESERDSETLESDNAKGKQSMEEKDMASRDSNGEIRYRCGETERTKGLE